MSTCRQSHYRYIVLHSINTHTHIHTHTHTHINKHKHTHNVEQAQVVIQSGPGEKQVPDTVMVSLLTQNTHTVAPNTGL